MIRAIPKSAAPSKKEAVITDDRKKTQIKIEMEADDKEGGHIAKPIHSSNCSRSAPVAAAIATDTWEEDDFWREFDSLSPTTVMPGQPPVSAPPFPPPPSPEDEHVKRTLALKFIEEKYSAPAKTAVEAASSPEAINSSMQKYEKMRRMLPEDAVRHRMTADGFSEDEINAFLNGDSVVVHRTRKGSSAGTMLGSIKTFNKESSLRDTVSGGNDSQKKTSDGSGQGFLASIHSFHNKQSLRKSTEDSSTTKSSCVSPKAVANSLEGLVKGFMNARRQNVKAEDDFDPDDDLEGW